MLEAFVCDAVRTPIGRYGGALSSVRADDLAAVPLRGLMARNPNADWTAVDDLNVAADFAVSRADQDAFAARSQARWADAQRKGIFRDEIVPMTIPQKKGDPVVVDTDEHPRPDTTIAMLAKLKGVNDPDLL